MGILLILQMLLDCNSHLLQLAFPAVWNGESCRLTMVLVQGLLPPETQ